MRPGGCSHGSFSAYLLQAGAISEAVLEDVVFVIRVA